jgi:hypothetical protein
MVAIFHRGTQHDCAPRKAVEAAADRYQLRSDVIRIVGNRNIEGATVPAEAFSSLERIVRNESIVEEKTFCKVVLSISDDV